LTRKSSGWAVALAVPLALLASATGALPVHATAASNYGCVAASGSQGQERHCSGYCVVRWSTIKAGGRLGTSTYPLLDIT
jgi:uncharacterized protein (UPF0303 family)